MILWPLSRIYAMFAWVDKATYRTGLRKVQASSLPVVVVGNLSVGGTGKSPLVSWLCEQFAQRGLRTGIVSRGYGGQVRQGAHRVSADDLASFVGDEPLMLARQTGRPVCVARRRSAAVALHEQAGDIDVVLSDDGLQHHAMARDIEIVVIDDARGFGNRWRLPAGPLREHASRVDEVDLVVHQRQPGVPEESGVASFVLGIDSCRHLASNERVPVSHFAGQTVHAVAAIGRPARFFETLRLANIEVIEHPLPDHHPLQVSDLRFGDSHAVLITAKDAVKLDAQQMGDVAAHVVDTRLLPSTALRSAIDTLVVDLSKHCSNAQESVDER